MSEPVRPTHFAALLPPEVDVEGELERLENYVYRLSLSRRGRSASGRVDHYLIYPVMEYERLSQLVSDFQVEIRQLYRLMVPEPPGTEFAAFLGSVLSECPQETLREQSKDLIRTINCTHVLGMFKDLNLESIDPASFQASKLSESGLPTEVVDLMIDSGTLRLEDVHHAVIPERTLRERRKSGRSLSHDESDRLLRLIRIIEQATATFDSRDKALRWLRKPKRRLEGRTPMEVLDTDAGAAEIGEWLERIEYGIAA